jgi:putative acetyltransferase
LAHYFFGRNHLNVALVDRFDSPLDLIGPRNLNLLGDFVVEAEKQHLGNLYAGVVRQRERRLQNLLSLGIHTAYYDLRKQSWQMAIMLPNIEIRREDILSAIPQQLILALNTELEQRYPEEGANFFRLDAEEVAEGRGAFLVAYVDGQPVGCGAVRRTDPHEAEIKRMYVAPTARGYGVGKRIVTELEALARELGVRRIVLETGPRQLEAIALYQRAGFAEIPLFGEYIGAKFSVCMAKDL